MMTPTRRALLQALTEISELHPDWRLGQTIENLCAMASDHGDLPAVGHIDDDVLLRALSEYLDRSRSMKSVGSGTAG